MRIKKSGNRKYIVRSLVIITIFAIGLTVSATFAAETVSFKGAPKTAKGDFEPLTGKLTKPQGDGPFPAVVLLHGCSGIGMFPDDWPERLAGWGYVALTVDSFGPRGFTEICSNMFRVPYPIRVQDAYDALCYLSGLPFVDRNRIGLIGWSHGGLSALAAVSRSNYATSAAIVTTRLEPPKQEHLFRAVIAFYPFCIGQLDDALAPLLILAGELDDWCPAALCQMKMPSGKTANEVLLKIYPGAYHGFDHNRDIVIQGHRILLNTQAQTGAIIQVRNFLGKHLK